MMSSRKERNVVASSGAGNLIAMKLSSNHNDTEVSEDFFTLTWSDKLWTNHYLTYYHGQRNPYLSMRIPSWSWTPSAVTLNDLVTSDWTISIFCKVFSPSKVHWLSTRFNGMPCPCHSTLNLSSKVVSGPSFCSWCSWRIIFCSYSIRPLSKGSISSSSGGSSLMLSRELTLFTFLKYRIWL